MVSQYLQTRPLGFHTSWDIKGMQSGPLLNHVASNGAMLYAILCQKTAIVPLILNNDGPKPRTDHILTYVAQNDDPRAYRPPASPHFLWLPPLPMAQTDKQTHRPPY